MDRLSRTRNVCEQGQPKSFLGALSAGLMPEMFDISSEKEMEMLSCLSERTP